MKKQETRYSMLQNAGYMIRLAWREQKSVLWLCLALAGLYVAISLAELFLAPLVLGKVEAAAPLPELFGTIAVMAGTLVLLRAAQAYINQNTEFGRIQLRMELKRNAFDSLYSWMRRCRLQPMKDAATTLRNHKEKILAYFYHRITNAVCEGINSMIQAAKRKARGFNTYEGFASMIYLVAGKLQLAVPNPF